MNYAVIEQGVVDNVVVVDEDNTSLADEEGWVPLGNREPMPWIGWLYDGQNFTPPPEPPPESLLPEAVAPMEIQGPETTEVPADVEPVHVVVQFEGQPYALALTPLSEEGRR